MNIQTFIFAKIRGYMPEYVPEWLAAEMVKNRFGQQIVSNKFYCCKNEYICKNIYDHMVDPHRGVHILSTSSN